MENLQTLITEKAKDFTVELSSLFEGLDLTDDLKESLQTTFDTAVKASSIQLTEEVLKEHTAQLEEKHVQEMIDLTEALDQQYEEKHQTLTESTALYLDEFLKEWSEKNKIAIDNSIKARLFDSIFESLSNVFVEHNLNVPTEEVHVMDELQEEVQELQTKVDSLLKERKSLEVQLKEQKLSQLIKELTENLTQTQIEKVIALSESIVIDDKVEQKLRTIVSMVEKMTKDEDETEDKGSEEKDKEKGESDKEDKENKKDKNLTENANLNYTENTEGKPAVSVNPTIAAYLKYAR